jgi:hypothetical protein
MERHWSTFTDYKAPENVRDILCETSSFRLEVDENCVFWFVTQRVVIIPYRRFGSTFLAHLQGSRIEEEEEE